MTIKQRELFIEKLKVNEGLVKHIYLDHLGFPTVGVGHLITKNDKEHDKPIGTPVTYARVMELLHNDLTIVESEIYVLFPDFAKYKYQAQHAFADLLFNLGMSRLRKFKKMLKAAENDDIPDIVKEIVNSRYYKQVANRAERNIRLIENCIPTIYE